MFTLFATRPNVVKLFIFRSEIPFSVLADQSILAHRCCKSHRKCFPLFGASGEKVQQINQCQSYAQTVGEVLFMITKLWRNCNSDCLGERFKKFFRNPGSSAARCGRSTVHQKPREISADFYNSEECLKPLKQPFLWDEIFTEFHFTFDDDDSRNAICLFHIRAVRREVKESSVRGDLKSAWFSSVYSKYLWGEKVWVTKAWARV